MSTERLFHLVNAKLKILQELELIAKRQMTVAVSDDASALLPLLGAKQQVIEVLQKIDRQLAPFREEDPESRQWSSPQARWQCQQQVARCEAVLREILLLEKQAEHAMIGQREAVQTQILQFEQAAAAQRAYLQVPAAVPSAFDMTTEG